MIAPAALRPALIEHAPTRRPLLVDPTRPIPSPVRLGSLPSNQRALIEALLRAARSGTTQAAQAAQAQP